MSFEVSLVKKSCEQINPASRTELEGILGRIYEESPWKWPHGLSINAHDEIYMIRKASTNEPAGFTGWQERMDGTDKIGFYTIGILPEYRGNGLAKSAVAKLISKKAATVDKVRALIVDGNQESIGLANALHVDYNLLKQASGKSYAANAVLGGLGNGVFWDQATHPEQPLSHSLDPRTYDKERGMMFALNALLGSSGALGIQKGVSMFGDKGLSAAERALGAAAVTGGIGALVLSPTKDLVMKSLSVPDKAKESLAIMDAKNLRPEPNNEMGAGTKTALGALLALGLGAGAYGVNRLANSSEAQAHNSQKARVKVTLPTRDESDHETTIDAPMADFGFSARVYNDLQRDTKRRLRGELDERKRKRVPKSPAATPMDKAAAQTPQAPVDPSRTPWANPAPTNQPDPKMVKQVEDAHNKIQELTQKLQAQKAPASSPTQTSFPSAAAVNSRVATAMKLIGVTKASSAMGPPAPAKAPLSGPPAPPKPAQLQPRTPLTVNQLQYGHDLANRTFRGRPGIQTPFMPFTVPFGRTAYELGTMARRMTFGSPRPSASAQFMEETPPSTSFQQQIIGQIPGILGSLA